MRAPPGHGSFAVDAIAFWAPTLPDWSHARGAFRDERAPLAAPARRPAPELLAAAERRRAPDTVALALEVAAAAVRAAERDAAALPSVFTSTHGDLAVSDYMCATLATSPTRRRCGPSCGTWSARSATASSRASRTSSR